MTDDERDYDEERYNAELCPACGISPCPFGGRCDEVPVVPLLSGVAVGPVVRVPGGEAFASLGRVRARYGVRTLDEGGRLVVLVAGRGRSTDEDDASRFRYLLGCLAPGEAVIRVVTEDEFMAAVTQ